MSSCRSKKGGSTQSTGARTVKIFGGEPRMSRKRSNTICRSTKALSKEAPRCEIRRSVRFSLLPHEKQVHHQGLNNQDELMRPPKLKKKENSSNDGPEKLVEDEKTVSFFDKKVTRREALSTAGKAAIVVGAAVVVGGGAYAAYNVLQPAKPKVTSLGFTA